MQVAKWGNSLAVRIPADVARMLGIKEGDEVELRSVQPGVIEISREESRARALETIRLLRKSLPEDYKFDRDEANAR